LEETLSRIGRITDLRSNEKRQSSDDKSLGESLREPSLSVKISPKVMYADLLKFTPPKDKNDPYK
jgi:hypothetical protein